MKILLQQIFCKCDICMNYLFISAKYACRKAHMTTETHSHIYPKLFRSLFNKYISILCPNSITKIKPESKMNQSFKTYIKIFCNEIFIQFLIHRSSLGFALIVKARKRISFCYWSSLNLGLFLFPFGQVRWLQIRFFTRSTHA